LPGGRDVLPATSASPARSGPTRSGAGTWIDPGTRKIDPFSSGNGSIDPMQEEIDPMQEEIDPMQEENEQGTDENDPMTGKSGSFSS
jgi:hypothetical protein